MRRASIRTGVSGMRRASIRRGRGRGTGTGTGAGTDRVRVKAGLCSRKLAVVFQQVPHHLNAIPRISKYSP